MLTHLLTAVAASLVSCQAFPLVPHHCTAASHCFIKRQRSGSSALAMAKTSSTTTKTRLITHKMCPFAQKAWIALETSRAPFQLEEISLYGAGGKPDWFWKLNPRGTVPVLVCNDDKDIFPDSDLILDQIEQGRVPGCQTNVLYSPEQASDIRAWRNRINQMLPISKKAVFSGSIGRSLDNQLSEMNNAIVGPYLVGDTLTTADCHAFPFLWRLDQEFDLSSQGYPNLKQWISTCAKEDSFRRTIQKAWWWWW